MRRLFISAFSFLLQSAAFSVPYVVCGAVLDSRLYLVYGLAYPLQALVNIACFAAEANVSSKTVKDCNSHSAKSSKVLQNSTLLVFIMTMIILAVVYQTMIPVYLRAVGGWEEYSAECLLVSVSFMCYSIVWLRNLIFEIRGKSHCMCGIVYFVMSVVSTILLLFMYFMGFQLTLRGTTIALTIFPVGFALILVVSYFWQKDSRDVSVKQALTISSTGIPKISGSVLSLIAYTIGYSKANSVESVTALTIAILSFDLVYDAIWVVDPHYYAISDNGRKDSVQAVLPRSVVLGVTLCIIPIGVVTFANMWGSLWLIVAVNCVSVIATCASRVFECYCTVNASIWFCTFVRIGTKGARAILTYRIPSVYATEYATCIVYIARAIVLYSVYLGCSKGWLKTDVSM